MPERRYRQQESVLILAGMTSFQAIAFGGVDNDFIDHVRITITGGSRRLGETGVVFRVGQNARQWIELENMRYAGGIPANVDTAPVADAKNPVGREHKDFDFFLLSLRNPCGTLKNIQWLVPRIPNPFGF